MFESLQQKSDEIRIPKPYSPEEIVETVKMKINDSINLDKPKAEKLEDFFSAIPNNTHVACPEENGSLDQSSHPVPVFNSTESLIGSVTSSSETLAETSHSLQNVQQSQIALARDAVENIWVELIPHMSSFIVQSNNQKTYSVQLFPKETCNCPSTTTCWHIIAAKLSVGNHNVLTTKRTLNLSQLK